MAAQLLRLVLFDMGDILHDASAWRRWLHHYLSSRNLFQGDYWALADQWEAGWLRQIHKGQIAYEAGFAHFLADLGLSEEEKQALWEMNWAVKHELEAQTQPFEGVPQTLDELGQMGLHRAVLTDSEHGEAGIWQKLRKLGLGARIDTVVSSADIGSRKPEERAFRYAEEKTEIPFAQTLFVAHDQDELEGGQALGIPVLAYNYRPGVSYDYAIEHFSELPGLLRQNFRLP